MDKIELDKGFWKIIINKNLDEIRITEDSNGYKKEFPISNIFNWLKDEPLCCIKRKILSRCQLCNLNKVRDEYLFPLIPINKESLLYNNLSELIISYYELKSSACDKCSYDINQKIKNNIFYNTCKQTIIKEINFPNLLLFIFDLSDEKEYDIAHFNNLISLRDQYKHLVATSININDDVYNLVSTCNQITQNHYSAFIINNRFKINNLKITRNYDYDGMSNNNALKEIVLKNNESIVEYILDYNPFLLFYLKEWNE